MNGYSLFILHHSPFTGKTMFGPTGNIYTIHENADLPDPSDRIELVREGFAFWAFVFGAVWLLAQRLWLPTIAYVIALALLGRTLELLEFSPAAMVVVQVGIQFLLACHANDIKRWVLDRRGYRMCGVVCAESQLMAQQRVFAAA